MAVPMEYLDAGRSPLPGRWIGAGIAVVVILAALLATATGVLGGRARAAVTESIAAADEQARAGLASVRGTLAYAEPLVWSSSVPEDVRLSLQELVRADALRVATGLTSLADGLRDTWLLPWQGTDRSERDAAVERIQRMAAPFGEAAEDVRRVPVLLSGASQ
jgi:hypothetical protein